MRRKWKKENGKNRIYLGSDLLRGLILPYLLKKFLEDLPV